MESYQPFTAEKAAFDTAARLERLQSLRAWLGLEEMDVVLGNAGAPVGIEIEITWPQAFPEMKEWDTMSVRPKDLPKDSRLYRQFSSDYNEHDQYLRPILERVRSVIPKVGSDAYWEFSFLPSHHIEVIVAELGTLYEANILHEDIECALHITASGKLSDIDAHGVLFFLEQYGGTSTDRLTVHTGWARKGQGGIKRRGPEQLIGKSTIGHEYRSLVATSALQVQGILELTQDLYRIIRTQPELWVQLRSEAFQCLRDHQLPVRQWPRPSTDKELWQKYASTLGATRLPTMTL